MLVSARKQKKLTSIEVDAHRLANQSDSDDVDQVRPANYAKYKDLVERGKARKAVSEGSRCMTVFGCRVNRCTSFTNGRSSVR